MKRYALASAFFFLLYLFPPVVRAEYFLPYPSFMPGSKLYTLSRIMDRLNAYWYFGSIGSSKYHAQLADKYLVESKVLFEYTQYLLAQDALLRSDMHIRQVPLFVRQAADEGKDVSSLRMQFLDELRIHIQTLTDMKSRLPKRVTWSPEKEQATDIGIEKLLDASIALRKNLGEEVRR